MQIHRTISILFLGLCASCTTKSSTPSSTNDDVNIIPEIFYYGADLSYVNEMIDCGAIYVDVLTI